MKILDSDHCVAILRGTLDLDRLTPDEELATTAISVGELVHGAAKSQRAQQNLERLDVLLTALRILAYDEWSARHFGQLKAQLEQAGEALSDADLQIASIALEQSAPLVTHNQKHFARLTGLTGLVLEDWLV
ncbi:MAG TPA: type II toxin-antitoxin system VapC family toxin [Anaerolineales bacterium]|nr:type II toxin-antitoxin system VapC family toxin [Anaerolineales bacterium]